MKPKPILLVPAAESLQISTESSVSEEVRRARDVLIAYHKDRGVQVNWIIDKSGVVICIFDDPTGMVRQTIEQQANAANAEVTN